MGGCVGRLVDGWLFGCLVVWLIGWLFGWLVGCLVGWLVGWLVVMGECVDVSVGWWMGG